MNKNEAIDALSGMKHYPIVFLSKKRFTTYLTKWDQETFIKQSKLIERYLCVVDRPDLELVFVRICKERLVDYVPPKNFTTSRCKTETEQKIVLQEKASRFTGLTSTIPVEFFMN